MRSILSTVRSTRLARLATKSRSRFFRQCEQGLSLFDSYETVDISLQFVPCSLCIYDSRSSSVIRLHPVQYVVSGAEAAATSVILFMAYAGFCHRRDTSDIKLQTAQLL